MSTAEIVALIISALAVCTTAVLKYAIDRRDKEIDGKLADAKVADHDQKTILAAEVKDITKKHHAIELSHAKLEGEVKVLTKTIEPIESDLKDIKNEMVPRQEWREAQGRIEQAQERLEDKLDKFVNFSQWRPSPSGGMAAAHRPLPREEGALDEYKAPSHLERDRKR
jgi:hypothetical protein